jgi:hypothetical protein
MGSAKRKKGIFPSPDNGAGDKENGFGAHGRRHDIGGSRNGVEAVGRRRHSGSSSDGLGHSDTSGGLGDALCGLVSREPMGSVKQKKGIFPSPDNGAGDKENDFGAHGRLRDTGGSKNGVEAVGLCRAHAVWVLQRMLMVGVGCFD